jgi:tRNA threonylcarbamoyladenosine biosynthesis protein TsaB
MKVLAIDTATERCSVALRIEGQVLVRSMDTARGHADNVLPLLDELLSEAGITLRELDGIAYGRGPGAFTGVRIAVGVVQGLAFGAQLLTVGISNLAAVAQQVAKPAERVLVCMDARMGEVYWAVFECDPESGLVVAAGPEQVGRPETVDPGAGLLSTLAGTGFGAHPQLAATFSQLPVHGGLLPRAQEVALLGEAELVAGRGKPAAEAQPVYLRDQVAIAKRSS